MKTLPEIIIKILYKKILKQFPFNYNFKYKTQKYDLMSILNGIFYILRTGLSWKWYLNGISGDTLYFHYRRFVNVHLFKNTYQETLIKYMKRNKTGKLKYTSTDTIIIKNRSGLIGDKVSRNKYFKNKNCTKISKLVDSNGISLHTLIDNGSKHDSTFVSEHLKSNIIDTCTLKYKCSNRHKQYFLADAAYDTKNIITMCNNYGYKVIIPQNIKNIKDPKKLRHLNKFEKKTYKNRIKVENHFSWIQHNKRLHCRNERYSHIFEEFVYLADLIIISKYL